MDTAGNAAARVDMAAIKPAAARLQTQVLDRAMQVFGAMGLTPDTPLARLWSWGRAMRFLDRPDEVHLRTVTRAELARARGRRGANAAHLRRWMPGCDRTLEIPPANPEAGRVAAGTQPNQRVPATDPSEAPAQPTLTWG
jgi:hypothetical protein